MSDSGTQHPRIFLGSDNQAGAHPSVLDAVARVSSGHAPAYGADDETARAERLIREVFETDCAVLMVSTGTAANALILSAMSPSWGAIYCHEDAHIINDENTAPEFYSGGARLIGVSGDKGLPELGAIADHIAQSQLRGVHNVQPAAISLSNVTEAGTVLPPAVTARFGALAQEHGVFLHMDGARFANAVVSSGRTPAELTWKSGVDALSFGLTKNGAIAAEAAIIFNESLVKDFEYRRKRAGQLLSKHRFLSAQFVAMLSDDLWLDCARQANQTAAKLAQGLADIPGVTFPWPTDANELFPVLPHGIARALADAGCGFYPWPVVEGMVRMVTSFATTESEIDEVLAIAHRGAN